MYKVHRAHLQSGYLKKVSCDAVRDSDGKPDWIFYYTPGPKAVAEFKTFNKNHVLSDIALETLIEVDTVCVGINKTSTNDAAGTRDCGGFPIAISQRQESDTAAKRTEARTQKSSANTAWKRLATLCASATRIAQETKYQPQNFSGIMQYEARAVADFDAHQKRSRDNAAIAAMHTVRSIWDGEFEKCEGRISRSNARTMSKRCAHLPRARHDVGVYRIMNEER